MIPAAPTATAAAALRRFKAASTPRQRAVLTLVAAGARLGGTRLLRDRVRVAIGDDPATLETMLTGVLGRRVQLSLYVSPPRAVRKPVLQLIDDAGTTLAFAKLGVDAFTSALVRTETHALTTLHTRTWATLSLPTVLHAGLWQDQCLLALSVLPGGDSPSLDAPLLTAAMREVAQVGAQHTATLRESSYRTRLAARIAHLPAASLADLLGDRLRSTVAACGESRFEFGSAHGDWAPWNMVAGPTRLAVWDWEKFSDDVPIGLDAVHFGVQGDVVLNGTDPIAAFAAARRSAANWLGWTGVDANGADTLVTLYAIDIATRYLEDGEATAGDTQLGHVARWLPSVLAATEPT